MDKTAERSGFVGAGDGAGGYEPPALIVIGSVAELTLGCDKMFGKSDGHTFHGISIVCTSP